MDAKQLGTAQSRAILSAISDGVITGDNQGQILFVNPAAKAILGCYGQAVLGRPVQDLFAAFEEAGRQKFLADLAALQKFVVEAGSSVPEMREIILEDEQRVVSARLTLALTPTGETVESPQEILGVVIILRDISREAQDDRAKSEFISNVSHELRTPMTSINGYATLLRQEAVGPLGEKQKYFLDIIRRNANRLSLLINDLLDVSRIESGKVKLVLKEVQLADLAQQVVESLAVSAAEKDLSLTLDAPANLPPVRVDGGCITQVLTNLVGNAIAYTETGGIEVSLQVVADVVQVSVKDSGIGLSPEEMAHIFDRFYRADHTVVQANTGTGLGLSIVKIFVEMHGGRIWVESQPNEGATFSFILPLTSENE